VDAHPTNTAISPMQISMLKMRCLFAMILSPFLQFVHELHGSKAPFPDIPGNNYMLILSDGLGHRPMSEM
jgi:hypothetical protein